MNSMSRALARLGTKSLSGNIVLPLRVLPFWAHPIDVLIECLVSFERPVSLTLLVHWAIGPLSLQYYF